MIPSMPKTASEWTAYVEYLMRRQGVSQVDVAAGLNYTQPGVRSFLKGETLPPLHIIPALARVLHADEGETRKLKDLAQEAALPAWVLVEIRALQETIRTMTVRQTEMELKLERIRRLHRRAGIAEDVQELVEGTVGRPLPTRKGLEALPGPR